MKSKAGSEPKSLELRAYLAALYAAWGPQHWWPADSAFEVIAGTILTQNTAWTNVEKALKNLRDAGVLSLEGIREIRPEHLEQMIRPAGYFRQKASRLKGFIAWLDTAYEGSLEKMFRTDLVRLREELLSLHGIGPETADSILLYAAQKEIFVVDAYTRRIFERHRLAKPGAMYDDIGLMVEAALRGGAVELTYSRSRQSRAGAVESGPGPAEELNEIVVHRPSRMSGKVRSEMARRFNEFHALLVQAAKHYCQSRVAKCDNCPLRPFLRSEVRISTRNRRQRLPKT